MGQPLHIASKILHAAAAAALAPADTSAANVAAVGYQLQVLAEALAAAQVLNRTLVPPRMVCYCTQDSSGWTDSLHTCAIAGSDKSPPFQCTLENLINVVELQRNYAHVMRTPGFLDRPELQQLVGGTKLGVEWSRQERGSQQGQQQDEPADMYAAQLLAAMQAQADADLRPVLPLVVTERQLRQRLGGYTATAVIDLGLLAPGWFAGFQDRKLAAYVQQMVKDLTVYVGWCCLLEAEAGQNMDNAYVTYQKPAIKLLPHAAGAVNDYDAVSEMTASVRAGSEAHTVRNVDSSLGAGVGIWQPDTALFQRPTWCSTEHLRPLNYNVSLRAQHPCHYLDGVRYTAAFKRGLHDALHTLHDSRMV